LLRLFFKNQSALMPLLLLSKSNPLRWASIWFWQVLWLTASIVVGYHTKTDRTRRVQSVFVMPGARRFLPKGGDFGAQPPCETPGGGIYSGIFAVRILTVVKSAV